MNPGRRALFLDRDGTIIVDTGYVRDPNDVTLLPGAGEALAGARALGYELVVVSNQSGVARGIISVVQLEAVQRRFEELLASHGVVLDETRFCLHGPDDGCACRKPASGLLRSAAAARNIDLRRSVMVGDRESDVLAGRGAGCTTIILRGTFKTETSGTETRAHHKVDSLADVPAVLRRLVDEASATS